MSTNNVGRPLKFQSVEELQKQIDNYFRACRANKELPTVTGLAYALDTSRRVLVEYEDRDGYSNAIKRAKTYIEAAIESAALMGKTNPAFTIFNFKNNFGWRDQTETKLSGGTDPIKLLLQEYGLIEGNDDDREGHEPVSGSPASQA